MMQMDGWMSSGGLAFAVFNYVGVGFFAVTGALAGAQKKHDVVTFAFFGAAAGLGGGTLRDLLLGAPVFWVEQPSFVAVALLAGAAVWLFGARSWRFPVLLWVDAVGLCLFAVFGAAKALSLGVHPMIAAVMGVITATAGGIIRDLLAHEPSVLLRREIYVTAAMVGAGAFVLAASLGLGPDLAGLLGFAVGFGLRAAALLFGLSLPAFSGGLWRARPQRPIS